MLGLRSVDQFVVRLLVAHTIWVSSRKGPKRAEAQLHFDLDSTFTGRYSFGLSGICILITSLSRHESARPTLLSSVPWSYQCCGNNLESLLLHLLFESARHIILLS
jgi:hypothetical protein